MRRSLPVLLTVCLIILPGCKLLGLQLTDKPAYRLSLITDIKAFEARLGFDETENFRVYSDEIEAYDYYFYTSRVELPYSLDDPLLQHAAGRTGDATIDLEEYDVFYYSIEAIAGVKTPVTESLLRAPLSRFIHVILHEDWHEQMDSPLGIEEPCAEVVSYQAAMLFAEEKFGQDSAVYQALKTEFSNKLEESELYRRYYEELINLYSQLDSGRITESAALSEKARIHEVMARDIKGIWRASPRQLNNAFIAFQMTYYRYLPLMYQVYSATDFNLAETMAIFRSVPAQGVKFDNVEELKNIEREVTDYLRKLVP